MPNSRAFCNEEDDFASSLVTPITEVRDSLGSLAVQVLAARENLNAMDYPTMLHKLMEIVSDLHKAYNEERTRLQS